jgi:hypothetical protein
VVAEKPRAGDKRCADVEHGEQQGRSKLQRKQFETWEQAAAEAVLAAVRLERPQIRARMHALSPTMASPPSRVVLRREQPPPPDERTCADERLDELEAAIAASDCIWQYGYGKTYAQQAVAAADALMAGSVCFNGYYSDAQRMFARLMHRCGNQASIHRRPFY